MNDRPPLVEQLHSDVDRLARQAPLANPYQPPLVRRPLPSRPAGPARRHGPQLVGAALLAAAIAAVLLVVVHPGSGRHQVVTTDQPPSTQSAPAPSTTAPATATVPVPGAGALTLPDLLPGTGATIEGITASTGASPPTAGYSYAQGYEGPAGPATARLVVTTVVAPAGALAGYASSLAGYAGSSGQAVTVAGQTGYLLDLPTHLQLLWQVPSGVVVSLEAINVDAADLTDIAALTQPRPAAELGVDVTGPLPDGLVAVGSGSTADDGFASTDVSNSLVSYLQDGCQASLQIAPGDAADFGAVAIAAGNGQSTTVDGHPGVIVDWGATENGMVTAMWTYSPGVVLRLQGDCSDIPTLATQLHPVSATAWDRAAASLGSRGRIGGTTSPPSSDTPPTSAPAPTGGGYTFGLAH